MVLCLFVLLLTTSNVYSQSLISKGQSVNQDGVFYTIDEHAKLISKIKSIDNKCSLEKEYLTKKLELKHNLDMSRLKIDNDLLLKKLQLQESLHSDNKKFLLKELEEERKIPWYKSEHFLFWTGFISATLVYTVAVYGYTKLK